MHSIAQATTATGADFWLPLIFLFVMGLAILIYVVLDGYDLGIGILLRGASPPQRDTMIASIGPFWDANETWLVLGVGILLVAFPLAHGVIMGALYLPVAMMLGGLILRGVAFDFRAKAQAPHRPIWDIAFHAGSVLASFAQGMMLGYMVTGFADSGADHAFALFIGICLLAGYALLGACWLIAKAEGDLQRLAIRWAYRSLWLTGAGIAAVSVATPWMSPSIFAKWFSLPEMILLAPIPVASLALFIGLERGLRWMGKAEIRRVERWRWAPFAGVVAIYVLAFNGLAYSLFPWLVIDRLNIWNSAGAANSLGFMLVGVVIVLPMILAYNVFVYRVFRGKATDLHYD